MFTVDEVTGEAALSYTPSPSELSVATSNGLNALAPAQTGVEDFWRVAALAVADTRFLELMHELYEERKANQLSS